jgi:hypothetical protein
MAAGAFCYNSFLIARLHRKFWELSKNMMKISPDELSALNHERFAVLTVGRN